MSSFWLHDFNQSPIKLILGSASPRRKELMSLAGFQFEIDVRPTEEDYPTTISPLEVASFVAFAKAQSFTNDDLRNKIVLTADTTVVLENTVLNKPNDKEHALEMLRSLSGTTHTVVTAYCILSQSGIIQGKDTAQVTFATHTEQELHYYIDTCKPFDKAGAYGIQDWMGVAGVTHINGSFCTVMGLPTHLIYQALKKWSEGN
jgi:septum formation protein